MLKKVFPFILAIAIWFAAVPTASADNILFTSQKFYLSLKQDKELARMYSSRSISLVSPMP